MKINPAGLTFERWFAAVIQQLSSTGDAVHVSSSEDWRAWVRKILMLPPISRQTAPQPEWFSDWLPWANAFNRSVDY
jgi:hypothetical protein